MRIVIFSGTTEGRKLSEFLCENEIEHHVCVATESGQQVMESSGYARVHVGRMDEEKMRTFLEEEASFVVDATHPYAQVVTETIRRVTTELSYEYWRVLRGKEEEIVEENTYFYESAEDCANKLSRLSGNILLTTGSKELQCYTKTESLRNRVYVRVLPSIEAITLCQKAGVMEKHILAMYGPHSLEMNEATIKQYRIDHLVTKESGRTGGEQSKLEAARKQGIWIHVIRRPEEREGISFTECMKRLEKRFELTKKGRCILKIALIGIGMGDEESLTIAAKKAIAKADVILGAKRMIEPYAQTHKTKERYSANQIIPFLEELLDAEENMGKVVRLAILFSGDSGIYSGATKLLEALRKWGHCDEIKVYPGISSFSAFAAQLGRSYTNACLESLHGKAKDMTNRERIAALIKEGMEVYLLMSGKQDFAVLSELITEEREVDIGWNLGSENQKILHTNQEKMCEIVEEMEDGLFIVRIGDA